MKGGELMNKVVFFESEIYKLIEKSLTSFYGLVKHENFEGDLDGILKVFKEKDVLYISKWLSQKGFHIIDELNNYEYYTDEKYYSHVRIREMILYLDMKVSDKEEFFISVTELFDTSLEFSRENGFKRDS